jgi:hypothetical protein
MAARTAVVRNVVIERGNDDSRGSAIDSIGTLKRATIYFDNNGIVVTGGTDTLDLDMKAAIEGSLRNGKTVTVRTCCISQALTTQLTAAPYTEVTHAGFITGAIASSAISITPKSDGYVTGSTNSTIAAVATVQNVRPYAVYCTFTEA